MRHPVSKNIVQLQRQANKNRRNGDPEPEYDGWRPQTRGECVDGPRPCPFVGCRYHLFLDVADKGGIKFNFEDDADALDEMENTCALDVADKGGIHLQSLGDHFNLTRERARQLEEIALKKLAKAGEVNFFLEADEDFPGY